VLAGQRLPAEQSEGAAHPNRPGAAELRAAADAVREAVGDDLPTGFRSAGTASCGGRRGSEPS
jgi:hypothetical protein